MNEARRNRDTLGALTILFTLFFGAFWAYGSARSTDVGAVNDLFELIVIVDLVCLIGVSYYDKRYNRFKKKL